MSDSPDTGSDSVSAPLNPPSRTFGWFEGLMITGIIVLLIALLLPAERTVREPGRRSQCKNNLKQIGLALHNYHDTYGALPPAYTVDADGKPLHSWRTLILPYLDQAPLYNSINLAKPWNDPANLKLFEESQVIGYQCPSVRAPKNATTYLASVGKNCCFDSTHARTFSEVTDDRSETLAVIEVMAEQAVPWMSPLDAYEELVLAIEPRTKQPHVGGTHALMADGAVRFVQETTSPRILRALLTISGRETIGDW